MMFGLSMKYEKNQDIDIKSFIKNDFEPKDKKRLRETLKKIKLTYQLVGEEVPTIMTEKYNCQVILFLEIEIDNIKNANFIANIIEEAVKSLCVIKLYDRSTERYSFAEKRLSLQDDNNVVIENMFLTKESSRYFQEIWVEKMQEYLDFNNIVLKENKLYFYREMMIKAYIISELNLALEGNKLLQSNLWYNSRKVKELFEILIEIDKQKLQLKKTNDLRERVEVNQRLKNLNEKIQKII